ncbi:MAG TPA: DUF1559 domain-containing protein [Lacipirellulaceae bacterium]|nr:DUF1559 domain-containing protein [Lacipirellulaceae bacterium]
MRNLTFPPAVTVISRGNDKPTSMSWRVAILPFLEQQNLYGSYKRDKAWDDSENRALFDKMPGVYSFDPQTETSLTRMQVFRGEGTAFGKTELDADPKSRPRPIEIKNIPDGASKTLLFVESGKDRAVTWTQPRDLEFDRDKPVESLGEIGPSGTVVAMMDGAVRVINSDVDPAVFRSMVLINDERGANLPRLPVDAPPSTPTSDPTPKTTAPLAQSNTPEAPAPTESAAPRDASKVFALPSQSVFPFERKMLACAYDAPTGQLMAAEYEQNQVTLYKVDASLVAVKQIPSPARPCAVVVKSYKGKSYFFVGGELDKRIDIFAANGGELASSIYIETPTIRRLASSKSPDDPYLYYVSRFGPDKRPYIGRFNLATKEDEGFIQVGERFAVASDGGTIFAPLLDQPNAHIGVLRIVNRPPPPSRESGLPPAKLTAEVVTSYWGQATVYTIGPSNTIIGLDHNLFLTSFHESHLGSLGFTTLAFSDVKPWAVGIEKGILHVASVNDKRTLVSVQLPEQFENEARMKERVKDDFKNHFTSLEQLTPVFVDDQRQLIIAATDDRVAVIPWKSLNLPDEPLVAVRCPSQVKVALGDSLEIPLTPFDPKLKVRLVSAPPGATYSDDKIHWTPATTDLGTGHFLVETTFGNLRFEQTIDAHVSRPSITLPVACQHIALSPDGKLAVAWSQSLPDNRPEVAIPGKLVLVDIEHQKVLGTKEVQQGIWVARVTSQGVFVLTIPPQTAGANSLTDVFRMNIPDLSVAATTAAAGRVPILEVAGDKFITACDEMFSLPDFKKIDSSVRTNAAIDNRRNSVMPASSRVDDSWFVDGVIWDKTLARAQMLVDPRGMLNQVRFRNPVMEVSASAASWGLTIRGSEIISPPDRVIMNGNGQQGRTPTVLNSVPAALLSGTGGRADGGEVLNVDVYDLVSGSKAQSIPFMANPQTAGADRRRSFGEARPAIEIDAGGNVFAACADSDLYIFDIKEINRKLLTEPFRFRWVQNPIVLAGGKSTKVTYELLEGDSPFQVTLNVAGVESRAQVERRAVVPVDMAAVTEKALELARQGALSTPNANAPGGPVDFKERLLDYVKAATPQFKLLTGHIPSGVPVLLPATVDATDRNLKATRLRHYYLIDLPETRVVQSYDTVANNVRHGTAGGRESRRASPPEAPRATKAEDADRSQKVAEINRNLAIDYGKKLMADYPSQNIDGDALKKRAADARDAAGASLQKELAETRATRLHSQRTWSDKKGHQTNAELKTVFAEQVTLKVASGNEVTVPVDKLSDQDQKFLGDSLRAQATPLELVVAQMSVLGRAMAQHNMDRGGFPPAFIAGADGKPLLSWRVAILPQIGGEDLFRLFHIDEPWDSPHNRELLPYMPNVYAAAEPGVAADHTVFLSFRYPRSALADGRPVQESEVVDGAQNAAALTEVIPDKAVEWTRPDDIPLRTMATLKPFLRERDGANLVAFLSGRVQALPSTASQSSWQKMIDYRDRSAPEAELRDPFAIVAAIPPSPPAAQPPASDK